jgi:RHS repeat-associated protein
VVYTRTANSDLVEYTRFNDSDTVTYAQTQRTYEANRNLVSSVQNEVLSAGGSLAGTPLSRYEYHNDALGRREAVENSGQIFSQAAFNTWEYNGKSELEDSRRYTGTYPSGTEVTAQRRQYSYDEIGNRLESTVGTSSPVYYCTDDLNRYVTLDDQQDCPPDPATESFSYDADGNLIQDGTYNYTWDAENRLKTASVRTVTANAKNLEFVYDYMGRRVRKLVYVYTNHWLTEPYYTYDFVYDEWNMALVVQKNDYDDDGVPNLTMTYRFTWGLDLSGTIHGAGGIGGLLAVHMTTDTGGGYKYWYFYDANGNVGEYLIANTPSALTHCPYSYQYDPYGNAISTPGGTQPFRFSTKWYDLETGLYYYGYRYYSPRLGRWISRDPSGEESGENLYTIVGNQPTGKVDPSGLWWTAASNPHDFVTREEGLPIVGADCAGTIADFDSDTDVNWRTTSSPFGDYRYHFNAHRVTGISNAAGRQAVIQEEQRRIQEGVRLGNRDEILRSVGRIAHIRQDEWSHRAGGRHLLDRHGHGAETPYDHAGLIPNIVIPIPNPLSPNFLKPHRPDEWESFPDDWQPTRDATRRVFEEYRDILMRCPCNCQNNG